MSIAAAVVVTGAAAFTTIGSASAASAQPDAKATSASSTAPKKAKLSATEDGHQLFAGIFFAQGPVAAKLAADSRLNGFEPGTNDSPEAVRAVAELAKKIERQSPGIFADFSAKTRSGDPRLVDAAMTSVSQALAAASDSDLSAASDSADCVTFVVAVAVAAVVIGVATGAFVVNAAAYINVVVEDTEPVENLTRDELVAVLTTDLRAA
ncbi:sporulation delaying protein family toxin [Streptomyces sp. NPDC060184]|uniref:sporulation delaying protein family toxin n=1 Tax=Streptomyces sp. NPDC060184 TaxID=3347064 RepID=UPI00366604E9